MTLKYFKRSEFNCKCGCNTNHIDSDFLEMMDKARRIAGVPFRVNSGLTCENHPLSKKNPTSSHIKGIAADIHFTDGKNLALIMGGLGGAGFERFESWLFKLFFFWQGKTVGSTNYFKKFG